MIREISVELGTALAANGFPFPVSDEDVTGKSVTTVGRTRVVVEYDEGGDSFGPPRGAHQNPKHHYTATTGGKITIYAQSPKAGAADFEHKRLAIRIRDRVLGAMRLVAANRLNRYRPTGGKFIPLEDSAAADRQAGAVYVITFTFDNAVEQLTWAGSARPEASLGLQMSGAPDLVFVAADSSITRSTGSWLGDGYAVGMSLSINGSESNDVHGTIVTATADTITLSTTLVDEGPTSGCTVRAGGFSSTSKVSQANGPDDDGDPNTPPITSETACGA